MMADLVIRGMEMPETCGLCQLCLDDSRICNGYCMFFHRRVNMMERDKNCPIIPLPEGHGRLGDLDALINELRNLLDKREKDAAFSGDREAGVTWDDAIHHIIAAPTIVPAEGGA